MLAILSSIIHITHIEPLMETPLYSCPWLPPHGSRADYSVLHRTADGILSEAAVEVDGLRHRMGVPWGYPKSWLVWESPDLKFG